MRRLRLVLACLVALPLLAASANGDAVIVLPYSCVDEGCVGGDLKCGEEVLVWNVNTGTWYTVQCYTSMN